MVKLPFQRIKEGRKIKDLLPIKDLSIDFLFNFYFSIRYFCQTKNFAVVNKKPISNVIK